MPNTVGYFAIRFDCAAAPVTRVEQVFKAVFCNNGGHYVFQPERGSETNRDHYQCYASRGKNHKIRHDQLGRELRDLLEITGSIYCQPASTNGKSALKYYCMKTETRMGDITYSDQKVAPKYNGEDVMCIEESPKAWQTQMLDMIAKPPHPRQINCVVDPIGEMGKTTLEKYLDWKGRSIQVPIGTASQLKTYICNRGPGPNLYCINFNRCMGRENSYRDVLTVCEDLKAGWVLPVMYGGGDCLRITRPHVWIFCNEAPPTHLLSRDMWKFWKLDTPFIGEEQILVPFVPVVPEKTIDDPSSILPAKRLRG